MYIYICYVFALLRFAGNKLRHSLEPRKYPYVSQEKVKLSLASDISGTARYWLVKMHGELVCSFDRV